ncbi:MAG: hypothetical protein NTU61_03220 [Candidatus Altiarchaeota archaeon]|nr:hypothetical protein [Candidatus Altiarchaeota archaeon]
MERLSVLTVLMVLMASGCICPGPDGQDSTTGGDSTATTLTSSSGGGGIGGALADMAAAIASGQSYRCVYKYQGIQSETIVKGEKFKSTASVGGHVSHSVSDGVWMYSWSEGESQGIKFKISDMKDLSSQQQSSGSGYTDLSQVAEMAANVECSPATISDSVFTPPSNVPFQDMGELIKQMQQQAGQAGAGAGGFQDSGDTSGEDILSTLCSACDMLPEGQKTPECKSKCG